LRESSLHFTLNLNPGSSANYLFRANSVDSNILRRKRILGVDKCGPECRNTAIAKAGDTDLTNTSGFLFAVSTSTTTKSIQMNRN
jgi:hypothetical protein